MTKMIFRTSKIYKDFENIFNNEDFTLKQYGFKRVVFLNTIKSKGNIQYKTAEKLLNIYNQYYNLNKKINHIFQKEKLLNYKEKPKREVIFEYVDDGNFTLFKFIDEILAIA